MNRYGLVTAGGSLLGAAMARFLLDSGYVVFAHAHRRRDRADELAREFPNARVHIADLSRADARIELCDRIKAETDTLDVLLNNLGVYPEVDLLNTGLELWEETIATTCTAAFHLTQLLLPALRRSAGARIVNIGDSGADRIEARALATPYHIAKAGLHILTRTYAQLLAPDGITVNMISPGFLEHSVGEPGELLPMGRPGRVEDVVAALKFVLSEAASYVSGTNLLVSGGWNLG